MNSSPASDNVPSILIVDDTPANLELLCAMLRPRGYHPRPVPSGKMALAAARAERPDLILLDVRMPDMDGFETCQQLKADNNLKDIPVIFITALTETAEKVKAFSLGAVDYLTKPFHTEEVEARVRTHLGIQSLQRELRTHNDRLEQLVARRTRELAYANERLMEFDRLKDDFLKMISHEIRTPANGMLGVGELIIALCPPSEDLARFSEAFHSCRTRLLTLLDDATLITSMDKLIPRDPSATALSGLLDKVGESLADVCLSVDPPSDMASVGIKGDAGLLRKALGTVVRMATAFSRDAHAVTIHCVREAETVRLRIDVDALSLSAEQTADFFKLESAVRIASSAASMGLGPVVAHDIIAALGGELRLVKGDDRTGSLETVLLREPNGIQSGAIATSSGTSAPSSPGAESADRPDRP